MAASLQAAATMMQPTKVGVQGPSSSVQLLRSSQSVCKVFGVEQTCSARLTCSVTDAKDLAQKCAVAAKVAGFALATSALLTSI